jgi:hypothetical protein
MTLLAIVTLRDGGRMGKETHNFFFFLPDASTFYPKKKK